jgi:tryptophan-rich sensory protein
MTTQSHRSVPSASLGSRLVAAVRRRPLLELVGWIGLAQAAGALGSLFTYSTLETWYVGLAQPALTPPNWAFPPVWFLLFSLAGTGAWLVSRSGASRRAKALALGAFGLQLALNVVWTVTFFGANGIGPGLVAIALLWLAVLANAVLNGRVDRRAGLALVPYLLWVSFAAYLNFEFWRLN